MPLYKYVCPERTDILEKGMIRFTQPKYLNDPFDTRVSINRILDINDSNRYFEIIKSSLPKIIKEIIQTANVPLDIDKITLFNLMNTTYGIATDLLQREFNNPNEVFKKYMSESLSAEINRTYGVLCLSSVANDALMWAHYGQGQKGFVIVFDNNQLFFNNGLIEDRNFGKIMEVQYSSTLTNIDNLRSENATRFFYIKPSDWTYEQEWRIIFPLDKADETSEGRNGEIIKLFKFPPEIITGIIFGSRTEESTIDIIKNLCSQDRYKHLKLYQIREIEDYKFKVEDYK